MDSTIGLLSPFTGLLDVRLTRAGGITTDLSYLALGGLVDQALTGAASQRGRTGLDGSAGTRGPPGTTETVAGRDPSGFSSGGGLGGEPTVGAVLRAAPTVAGAAGRPQTKADVSAGASRTESVGSSGRSTGKTDGISLDRLDAQTPDDDASERDSSGDSPARDAATGSTADQSGRQLSADRPAVSEGSGSAVSEGSGSARVEEHGSARVGGTASSNELHSHRTVFEPMTVLTLDVPGSVEAGQSPGRTQRDGRPFPEITSTSSGDRSPGSVFGFPDVTVLDPLGSRAIGSDGQTPSVGSSSESDGPALQRPGERGQSGRSSGNTRETGDTDGLGLTPVDARDPGPSDGFARASSGPLAGDSRRGSAIGPRTDTDRSMVGDYATLTTVDQTAQSAGSAAVGAPAGSSAVGSFDGSSAVGAPGGSSAVGSFDGSSAVGALGGSSAAGTLDGPSSPDAPTMTFGTDSGSSAPRPDSSRADGPSLTVRHERDATDPDGDDTSPAESETGPADSLDESAQSPAPPDPVQWLQENGEDSRRFIDQLYRELERKVAIERDRGGSLL